ncbi:MAG: RNA polymerase sigma factor [Candidatus Cloacimonetes bacterium]|nr:RNA polymerase sigma factor [Candidatus Cloacimonadota bacterium]
MNKEIADKTIEKYTYKIYGFSLTKTMNIDIAEELASNITFEVYKAFLKLDIISNLDGFIWKIASNVYSQFVSKEVKHRSMNPILKEDSESDFDEQIDRLRHEIAFLSKTQREVIVLHYFDKLKISEIAERLNLSLGTVKWHLHEARNSLRENYLDDRESNIKPQEPLFTEMINRGFIGSWGIGMNYYFQRNFSQNIAYSIYNQAKTSVEIAKELAVPVVFIEDEINHLCENGFINKEPGSRFRTNFCIIKPVREDNDRVKKYAKLITDMYISLINPESFSQFLGNTLYSPNNDMNFFLWSIFTFACSRKLRFINERIMWSKYLVKRKDGGRNIAYAKIDDGKNTNKDNKFKNIDQIKYYNPDICPMYYWQFNSHFDERKGSEYLIYKTLYDFSKGLIPREPAYVDNYKLLFDKGLIVSKGKTEIANTVICSLSLIDLEALLPDIPNSLKILGKELDEEIFEQNRANYALHLQDLGRALTINSLADGSIRVAVLENLLDLGIIKPLKKNQKLSVNTIMFCDSLPITKII